MLKNLVEETANNPGTGTTVTLAGAPVGRLTWRGSGFSNGAQVFYFITDGVLSEWGVGTLNLGASDTISRNTVLGNSSGSNSRLNFTGTCRVYNALPAERALYLGGTMLSLETDLTVSKASPTLTLNKLAGNQTNGIYGQTAGSPRWGVLLGTNETENGGHSGSNFQIGRFRDDGSWIDAPLAINRATGDVAVLHNFSSSKTISAQHFTATGTIGAQGSIYSLGPIVSRSVDSGAGATGYVRLSTGETGPNLSRTAPGYTEFFTADNVRRGFIGYANLAPTSPRVIWAAENGWGLQTNGEMFHSSHVYMESGQLFIRSNGNRMVNLTDANGNERGLIWSEAATNNLLMRAGGPTGRIWTLEPGGRLMSPAVSANTGRDNNVVALEARNSGGTGDADTAAIGLHCTNRFATKIYLRHDGYLGIGGWSADAWRWYVATGTGDMVAAGNVSAYSDPNLKDNVERIASPLDIVDNLDGVRFTWNDRSSLIGSPGKRDIGVLADQVEAVLPELVTLSVEDPKTGERYRTVAYDKLVPVLIEAIKELRAQVQTLSQSSEARA